MIFPRLIAIALGLTLVSAGGSALPDASTLVDLEHDFARDAQSLGTRDAFLKWVSPTGVLFRPGPVNGRKALLARPGNAGRLAWEPVVAMMSSGGDLGWTSGPWTYRVDSTQAQPVAWGDYVTLWRRGPDGSWGVALDIGVEHAAPDSQPPACSGSVLPAPARTGRGPLGRRQALWKTDVEFARVAGLSGVAGAIEAYGAEDVHRLRDAHFRVIGMPAARDSAAAVNERGSFMSLAQFISENGDLGYTYGTFARTRSAGTDSSYYLHIWKRGRTRPWDLVLDLLLPIPKPAK